MPLLATLRHCRSSAEPTRRLRIRQVSPGQCSSWIRPWSWANHRCAKHLSLGTLDRVSSSTALACRPVLPHGLANS